MSDYQLTDTEQDILKVLKYTIDYTKDTPSLKPVREEMDANIATSKALLRSLGREDLLENMVVEKLPVSKRRIVVRSWDNLVKDANEQILGNITFEDLFSPAEIAANRAYIQKLHDDFNAIHKFDFIDGCIPIIAGTIGGVLDFLFGGFVRVASGKSVPGVFSKYVGNLFDKALPLDKIAELEKLAKVTYDAQDNRNTSVYVDGLSSHYHRLYSVGHDPILGIAAGTLDMLRRTMLTIDRNGKFAIQPMAVYDDRQAQNVFEALTKVCLHHLSDVNTQAGLPVPFMTLFNTLQVGSIGEENQNVAEVVRGMYRQGYDFRHFCSMSIPVMIIEVLVRLFYFAKRLHDGHTFKEAIPFGSRRKKPKLGTMLFIAHSVSAAINAGKIALTRNPLDINYAQWIFWAGYSFRQLHWVLREKPMLRDQYVSGMLEGEWATLSASIDELWQQMTDDAIIVFE